MKWNLRFIKYVSYCLSALSLFSASYLYYLQSSGDWYPVLKNYTQEYTENQRKMKPSETKKAIANTGEIDD